MADQIFENPRLAAIYDDFDGKRDDLGHYLKIVQEFKAQSILDVGCGTGSFSCLLSQHGFDVTGLDPAKASLEITSKKPYADGVKWIHGDTSKLPQRSFDMAVMTGNVAQVFLSDRDWENTLSSIHTVLSSTGSLVFEVRNPEKQSWLGWTREKTYRRIKTTDEGFVEGWCEVTDVTNELVSFKWTYVFEQDGETISSNSTLRFRKQDAIEESLAKSGYRIIDLRDAPDRPGNEWIFVARPA